MNAESAIVPIPTSATSICQEQVPDFLQVRVRQEHLPRPAVLRERRGVERIEGPAESLRQRAGELDGVDQVRGRSDVAHELSDTHTGHRTRRRHVANEIRQRPAAGHPDEDAGPDQIGDDGAGDVSDRSARRLDTRASDGAHDDDMPEPEPLLKGILEAALAQVVCSATEIRDDAGGAGLLEQPRDAQTARRRRSARSPI